MKLPNPVNPEFECEVLDDVKVDDVYLVRPCQRYQEIYKSCKSFKGRIHQYYVYGEFFDCNDHKNNYNNCLNYRKTKDENYLEGIISWEKRMIEVRTAAALSNPIWEFRTQPPADFKAPLPSFLDNSKKNH